MRFGSTFPASTQEHAKISEVALIALGPDCAIGDVPLEQGRAASSMPGDEIQIGSVVLALDGHDPGSDRRAVPTRAADPRRRGQNFGDELFLQ